MPGTTSGCPSRIYGTDQGPKTTVTVVCTGCTFVKVSCLQATHSQVLRADLRLVTGLSRNCHRSRLLSVQSGLQCWHRIGRTSRRRGCSARTSSRLDVSGRMLPLKCTQRLNCIRTCTFLALHQDGRGCRPSESPCAGGRADWPAASACKLAQAHCRTTARPGVQPRGTIQRMSMITG